MNAVLVIVAILVGAAALVVGAAFAKMAWVASGESDVNGSPEYDGGLDDDDEIAASARAWDRGSAQTFQRPNLDAARRANRAAMARALLRYTTQDTERMPL